MAFSNNMTLLLNKVEDRLGLDMIDLPDQLKKETWAEKVVIPMTLCTWSRYFPHEIRYHVDASHKKKNGWYLLDEDLFNGVKILGVKNLDWSTFNVDSYGGAYGIQDYVATGYDISSMVDLISAANMNSLFNNGLYPTFEPPNRFRLETTYGNPAHIDQFTVLVLVEHSPNLLTISPTQMETFESLAQADIAGYLYNKLKMFQDLQTVYATVNIHLDDLQNEAQKRDDIINYIKESYVSAANKNQPLMFTI